MLFDIHSLTTCVEGRFFNGFKEKENLSRPSCCIVWNWQIVTAEAQKVACYLWKDDFAHLFSFYL